MNPLSFLYVVWREKPLIFEFTRRKVASRYRGSMLGMLWAVLNPLLMLSIYTFVFSVVFRSRWGVESGGEGEFALFLYSGLMLYMVFSECVNEAPDSLLANSMYIQQHVFPSEIIAWVSVLSSLFGFAINLFILAIFYAIILGIPGATAFYMPLLVIPVMLWTLGIVWIVSSVSVYLRDLSQIIPPLTTALLFLSPIFYPATRVPESLRSIYELNPFVFVLETARGVLFFHRSPDWSDFGASVLIAAFVAWFGYMGFMGTKKGFADVL